MNNGLPSSTVTYLGINPDHYLFCGTIDAAMFRWPFNPQISEESKTDLMALALTPNPCQRILNITYGIKRSGMVRIDVFDAGGRLIATVVNKNQAAGSHRCHWTGVDRNGNLVPTGVYFIRSMTDSDVNTGKFVLIR
ncbi:MAG TPA: T9SS type A sorting domain-containing protein [bacterium (Candidatus Stahlbacteria)]|nr:T9SS type A sorting domain-containing protein [Candidatus Stahlbacteria bacterium]